jgi:hypothetical protein
MAEKTTDYKCKICNKYYKTYVTLWKHNKKFHINYDTKTTLNDTINDTKKTLNVTNPSTNLNNKKYDCQFCNKIFNFRQNKYQHEKTCKNSENFYQLKEENKIMKQQINELKTQFALILKEKGRMHPKTLQKINKQMNNITKNSHNNNDYSVTNNTYITFPNLDYTKIFTSSQIKGILNKQYMSLEESIKQVHFNENLPEYSNIFITNMRDDLAYVFNGKEFVAVKKNTMLNEINLSLEKYKKKLAPSVIEILEKFLDKLNDQYTKKIDYDTDKTYPNYKAYKIDHIKLLIYNESDKYKLELLKTMQLEEKTYEELDSEEIII